jgi:amino acid adenylation domain-containing protein
MKDNILKTINEFRESEKYWLEKLSGELTGVKLPADFSRTKSYEESICKIEFKGELSEKIFSISKRNDLASFILLLASFKVLLFKYIDRDDIIIGSPIQSASIQKYNKYIVFRDFVHNEMTFKNILMNVKETVVEGTKNEFFPFKNLFEVLEIKDSISLFRVVFLFENIHEKELLKDILNDFENEIILSICRNQEELNGKIIYNSNLFKKETIERLSNHYLYILNQVLYKVDSRINDIELMTEREKNKILFEFNRTEKDYPGKKTIAGLFECQVEKNPENIAVVSTIELKNGYDQLKPGMISVQVSYEELNERANQFARLLRRKGVKANTIVGVMVQHPIELVVSLLGVLKSGGAYLPIDHKYPSQFNHYIFEDSNVEVLLVESSLADTMSEEISSLSVIPIDEEDFSGYDTSNLESISTSSDLVYVIYTSGTTGRPKGVLIKNEGIVNYTKWRIKTYNYTSSDVTLQPLSYAFDGFGSNFYSSLLSGGTLFMVPGSKRLDVEYISYVIEEYRITNISLVPDIYKLILENAGQSNLESLRFVVLAGDKSKSDLVKLSKEKAPKAVIINEYGPTETSVTAVAYVGMEEYKTNIIGEPISNTHIYILNKSKEYVPIGIPGQLHISGIGVSRGYLNNIELTSEKLILSPCEKRERLYKSGDIARWSPDGNIEFMGRIDNQIKIRGYRAELGEIENQLLKHKMLKDVVVISKEEGENKYLCAYIVIDKARRQRGEEEHVEESTIEHSELQDYLSKRLPEHMVPTYFVEIEKIPLTPNGKVDRRALPEPGRVSKEEYTAPGSEMEIKLAGIWSEVLGIEKEVISINSNFFHLGGNSLNATVLISRVHKELNVKLSIIDIFEKLNIRELSKYIGNLKEDKHISINPVEKREYYKLSSAQKRMYILQQIDVNSTAYNISDIYTLEEDVDKRKIEDVFKKMITRHESLRTSFLEINGEPFQRIHENVNFKIEEYEPGEIDIEERGEKIKKINDQFNRAFDLLHAPFFRVSLTKISREKYILMIVMHHVISDFITQDILLDDFRAIYEGGKKGELRLQYKDYSEWQDYLIKIEKIKEQENYWLNVLDGDLPILNIPTDYIRPEIQSFKGDLVSFKIEKNDKLALKSMALKEVVTDQIIMLTIFNILLSKICGQNDIIIGTPVGGRSHIELENIVGIFMNTIVLRNFPSENKSFLEFLKEVKQNSLKAYENQDYQFEDLVSKVLAKRNPGRNPLYDVMFEIKNVVRNNEDSYGANTDDIDDRLNTLSDKTAQVDMYWCGADIGEYFYFTISYNTKLFKENSIQKFLKWFKEIIEQVINDNHVKIGDIKISHDYILAASDISEDKQENFQFN